MPPPRHRPRRACFERRRARAPDADPYADPTRDTDATPIPTATETPTPTPTPADTPRPAPPVKLAWRAGDPDGGELSFTLLYSADDGATWEVLAAGLSGTTARLSSLEGIPSTDALRFRVIASDGFHAAEATTPDRYSTGNSPPSAVIVQPADGATYERGEAVFLSAVAVDAEDGSLAGDQLRWRSSLDGELGAGARLLTHELRPGTHVVTLIARDSGGAVAEQRVTIVVGEGPGRPGPSDEEERALLHAFGVTTAGSPRWPWYAVAAAALLLILAAGAFGARRLRRG